MWIETQSNMLVNLDALKNIGTTVKHDQVIITGKQDAHDYITIASLKSQEDAIKFLKRLMREAGAGKNCVSADAIIISIENEK